MLTLKVLVSIAEANELFQKYPGRIEIVDSMTRVSVQPKSERERNWSPVSLVMRLYNAIETEFVYKAEAKNIWLAKISENLASYSPTIANMKKRGLLKNSDDNNGYIKIPLLRASSGEVVTAGRTRIDETTMRYDPIIQDQPKEDFSIGGETQRLILAYMPDGSFTGTEMQAILRSLGHKKSAEAIRDSCNRLCKRKALVIVSKRADGANIYERVKEEIVG